MKGIWKAAWRWTWRQIVQPDPGEERPPQDGPIELWSSRPTNAGERPERKIAGCRSRQQVDRIAENMGLLVYHVLESDGEKIHAKLDAEIREAKQRAAVSAA